MMVALVDRVAVVIPTWNRPDLLAQVLADLGRQTYPIDRVIVVDNGSDRRFGGGGATPGAEVITLGANAGFAAAVNRGIQEAGSEWIAVLNNDVSLEPDWLEKLMGRLGNDGWFATGKLLDASAHERIDGTFDALCRGGCAWRCGHGRLDSALWNQPRSIQLAPFTAAVFRADLFHRVGLLDEQFRVYLEDVDFGLRCAEQGLERFVCARSSRVSRRQRDAGPLASGHGAEDRAQSVTAGGETLSAGLGHTLWLVSSRRSNLMGIRRSPPWSFSKLPGGQDGRLRAAFARREESTAPTFLPASNFLRSSSEASRKSATYRA